MGIPCSLHDIHSGNNIAHEGKCIADYAFWHNGQRKDAAFSLLYGANSDLVSLLLTNGDPDDLNIRTIDEYVTVKVAVLRAHGAQNSAFSTHAPNLERDYQQFVTKLKRRFSSEDVKTSELLNSSMIVWSHCSSLRSKYHLGKPIARPGVPGKYV